MEAIDVIKNISTIWLIILTSLSYCYFISSNLPKGIFRLLSLPPIFLLLTLLPLHLSSAFATAVTAFFITWICNFKLVLFAFDHGPLSWQKSKVSLHIFLIMAALPMKTKQENDHMPIKRKVPLNLAVETLVFALATEFLVHYRETVDPRLLQILYGVILFLLIDILVACSGWIVKTITGLELEKPSNEPYLSTSLQDFWGRRWNLTVTNALRQTVYYPVRTALENILGKGWFPSCLAMLASFVVSGLMHELIIYQITHVSPSWDMTLFFVIHGVLVVIEVTLKKWFKGKLKLPWFVSGPITIGIVLASAFRFFFQPLISIGADVIVLEEFRLCGEYVKNKILHFSSL
ncbi:hypothetical protein Leryth_013748 [Lithospermum erythrorhizon]|nr:hypothetical protein Leryth_013748 [Lithospermum erythrorhizon]